MKKQSHTKIWIHLTFSTFSCQALIHPAAQGVIVEHLRLQLLELGCAPRLVTGMPDHVHLLFLYNSTKSLCDIVRQVKGNTSHWINEHDLSEHKFVWQKGFTAFSEGEQGLAGLIENLEHQAEYHATKTYLQELDELKGAHVSGVAVLDEEQLRGDRLSHLSGLSGDHEKSRT